MNYLELIEELYKLFPPHFSFIDVFGSNPLLLLNKEPKPIDVYNDTAGDVVNFFRVLRTDDRFNLLRIRFGHEEAMRILAEEDSKIRRAQAMYVLMKNIKTKINHDVPDGHPIVFYYRIYDKLDIIHQRWKSVFVEHSDVFKILDRYDFHNALFFLDPQQILLTKLGQRIFGRDEMMKLAEKLSSVEGSWILITRECFDELFLNIAVQNTILQSGQDKIFVYMKQNKTIYDRESKTFMLPLDYVIE